MHDTILRITADKQKSGVPFGTPLFVLSIVVILAEGAFGVVKIVPLTAFGTLLLGQPFFFCIGQKELQLSAFGAAVDLNFHSACQQIGKVTQDPTGLTKL